MRKSPITNSTKRVEYNFLAFRTLLAPISCPMKAHAAYWKARAIIDGITIRFSKIIMVAYCVTP